MNKFKQALVNGTILLVFFGCMINHSLAQGVTVSSVERYQGNSNRVEKIVYDRLGLLNKNVKGKIFKVAELEWKDEGNSGNFNLLEAGRKGGKIYLDDTLNKRKLMIDLDKKYVHLKGKGSIWSAIARITDIGESSSDEKENPKLITKPEKVLKDEITDKKTDQNPVTANAEPVSLQTDAVPATEIIVPGKENNAAVEIPELNASPVYYAILIAECDYKDETIKDLPGTARDMRRIYDVLTGKYIFEVANTDTLVNATKQAILSKIYERASTLTENDNLFIFYAGHGELKKYEDGNEEGFLVPADALKDNPTTFITSNDLVGTMKRSKAKHILFTADACFAGALFRDLSSDAPTSVVEAYRDKSRKVLSSGNRQAVPDESDFMESFRLALQENKSKFITTEKLVDSFKDQYRNTTHLQLQYYPIHYVDDRGGEFVFVRR